MLSQMIEQGLVCLGRAESVRIGDHLPHRRRHRRAVRQLSGRRVQVAAENHAARRRERLHIIAIWRARSAGVQRLCRCATPTEISAGPNFTLVTNPVGLPTRDHAAGRASAAPVVDADCASRSRSRPSNGTELRIALPMYVSIFLSLSAEPEFANIRTAHPERLAELLRDVATRRSPHSGINLAQQNHIGARERLALQTLQDLAEPRTARRIEQHDPQPRSRRAAPHDSRRSAENAASPWRQPR